jgi:hypothetical protein
MLLKTGLWGANPGSVDFRLLPDHSTFRTATKETVCRIELSSKVIDSCDRLRDTLIHELCHAACSIISKKCDNHGPIW